MLPLKGPERDFTTKKCHFPVDCPFPGHCSSSGTLPGSCKSMASHKTPSLLPSSRARGAQGSWSVRGLTAVKGHQVPSIHVISRASQPGEESSRALQVTQGKTLQGLSEQRNGDALGRVRWNRQDRAGE